MQKVAVIGLGKVGSLVATLLGRQFSVVGVDASAAAGGLGQMTMRCGEAGSRG